MSDKLKSVVIFFKGLKVNDQLVTYATRFLAVCLNIHVWSHHHAFKAKVFVVILILVIITIIVIIIIMMTMCREVL